MKIFSNINFSDNHKNAFSVSLFCFLVFLLCIKGSFGNFTTSKEIVKTIIPGAAFEWSGSPFEFSRMRTSYVQLISVVTHGTFRFTAEQAQISKPDVGYLNGKLYSWAPPGLSVVGAFFYLLFYPFNLGQFGAYLLLAISASISIFFLYLLSRCCFLSSKRTALIACIGFAVGTISIVYATTFLQHHILSMFLAISLYSLYKMTITDKLFWGQLIAFIYGISPFFDYPNLIILFPIITSALFISIRKSKKNIFRLGIFTLLPLAFLLFFQQQTYGSWTQMSNTLIGYNQINLSFIASNQEHYSAFKNNPLNIFSGARVAEGLHTLILNPQKSLFFFSPFLIFILLWRCKKESSLISTNMWLVITLNFILYASFIDPWGGWAFGPRYLIPAAFCMSIFAAQVFETLKKPFKYFFYFLLSYSIVTNLAGALTTITIPPHTETLRYGIKNFDYLISNTTGSLVYKTFFSGIPLYSYYILILSIILLYQYYIFKRND